MKNINTHTNQILKNLLKINNDRAKSYQKAAEETTELDLKTIFLSLRDESTKNTRELLGELGKTGASIPADATTISGKFFRVWMDVKSTLTGRDRDFILNSCEHGEATTQRAYRSAISSTTLSTEVRQLIRNQQVALIASHDWIKNYRERSHYGYARTF